MLKKNILYFCSLNLNQINSNQLYLFLSVLICMNCSSKTTDEDNYKLYNYNQNEWKSKQVIQYTNDINFTATEVPLEYYLLKNLGDKSSKIDSLLLLNSKERVIEFQFQHITDNDLLKNKYTNLNYEDAVKYMAFKIEKDFKIVTSTNDTISCSGLHFERHFKITPYKKLLLYFDNIPQNIDFKLIYSDNLFNKGLLTFDFQDLPLKL